MSQSRRNQFITLNNTEGNYNGILSFPRSIPLWKNPVDRTKTLHTQDRRINPDVARLIKEGAGVEQGGIPSGVAYNKSTRRIYKILTDKGNFSPSVKRLLDNVNSRDKTLISNRDIVVVDGFSRDEKVGARLSSKLTNKKKFSLAPRSDFFAYAGKPEEKLRRDIDEIQDQGKKVSSGYYQPLINDTSPTNVLRVNNQRQTRRDKNKQIPVAVGKKPVGVSRPSSYDKVYNKPKRSNEGASVFQIYNYFDDAPSDIQTFIEDIKASYTTDFTSSDKTRPNHKVLLLFGDSGTEYRWFDLDNIDDLVFMIDQFNIKENGTGSDAKQIDGQTLVSLEKLNMSYFRISLSGSPIAGAKGTQAAHSRYFFLNQPTTSNNECLEGSIKRFLGLKERVHTIRFNMTEMSDEIKLGEMIKFSSLTLYEDCYEININVYSDTPHIIDGEINANLIRDSVKKYDRTMKLLFREDHFFLIKSNKKCINSISRNDCRLLGIPRSKTKTYKSIGDLLNPPSARKSRGMREVAVIFDNETIFDRFDEQFIKVYGVSWFVWDFTEHFDYASGWNEDKTDNIYHHEPYCYYENGEDCEDKLIKFLLNPKEGCIYRPMGFNNSRFDNFSFCQSASKFRVLTDVFLVGGAILKCNIEGIKSVWDASRFLIGQSLDGACKSYDTNPKKQKDLINHYEIQCYYERNGMDGLVELLNKREEYILYNKFDVISLCDLIQKMRNSYSQLFEEDIFESLTISSYGYKILEKTWKGDSWVREQIKQKYQTPFLEAKANKNKDKMKEIDEIVDCELKTAKPKYDIYKSKDYREDLFYRDALTAGRTQSFYGKLDLSMPLAMCDVKSLYPTIMGSYDNDCPMPYGITIMRSAEQGYKKDHLGIYRCNIKHQRCVWKNQDRMVEAFKRVKQETGKNLFKQYAPNVIARREKDKPLDWFYKGEIKDVKLTSVDIEVLRWATEDYDCVEVLDGYYWTESSKELFKDFLDPPKQEKTRQDKLKAEGSSEYNNAIREGCKGISNAISGKVIEQIHEDITKSFSLKNWSKLEQDEGIYALDVQDFGCGLSFITGKKNASSVFNDCENSKRKPSYLGVFIYSYSRKLMYQKLLSRYLCLYMDTDSACMPLFEWERCMAEDYDKTLCNTGQYGCLEEEVCYTDKTTGEFTPANRLIGISPKNYCVLNDKCDFLSKRKFKGVRKTDLWCPLTKFGEYDYDENDKLIGDGVDTIRGNKSKGISKMSQDEIRRFRETNCCEKCINMKLETGEICGECKKYSGELQKAYTTEMFERLCNGEKIAVFCSMIQRITNQLGNEMTNDNLEKLGSSMSVEELESVVMSAEENKTPFQFTLTSKNMNTWKKLKEQFKINNPNFDSKDLKNKFTQFYNRFRKITNERELKNLFALKQAYMVKII